MKNKKRMRLWITIAAAAAVLAAAVIASAVPDLPDIDDVTLIGTTGECPTCHDSGTAHQLNGPDPTCYSAQYALYKCSACGTFWKVLIRNQRQHFMVIAAGSEKPATCVSAGERKLTCRHGCGCEETEEIPLDPAAHQLEENAASPAQCEVPGCKAHWACTLCGSLYTDAAGSERTTLKALEIPAQGHAWDLVITDPTCTSGGCTTKTCSVCGASGGTTDLTDPAPHRMEKENGIKETCTLPGAKDLYTCTVCRGVFVDKDGAERASEDNRQIPASGHSLVLRTAGAAPSCEEGGVREHWTCTKCGLVFADAQGSGELVDTSVSPAGHSPEYVSGKDASCETEGSSEYWHCTQCGKFFSDEDCETDISFEDTHVPAAGHKLEHFPEKKAGEDEDGWCEHWKCTVCGKLFAGPDGKDEVRPEDVFVLTGGHTLMPVAERPAQCTKDGLAAHYACSGCGALFLDANAERPVNEETLRIPAPGHAEDAKVKDPTCTESGQTTHTCRVCGHVRTALVRDALGHDMVHVAEKPATETKAGEKAHWRCTRCGLLFQDKNAKEPAGSLEIPAAGHSWEDTVIPPTCTEPGYTQHTCAGCGDVRKDNETPAAGHMLDLVPGKPAAEDEEGIKEHWKCTVCGALFEDEDTQREIEDPASLILPALGHAYEDTVVAADCVTGGYTEHVCAGCGRMYTDMETDPLGHVLTRFPAQAPTLTREGNIEYWKCERCAKYFGDAEGRSEIPPESVVRARLEKDPGGGSVATGDTKDPFWYLICAGGSSALFLLILFAARRRVNRER